MIELKIWDYESMEPLVPNFLQSASLAHKQTIKSTEWFRWKFEGSPYGKAIIAAALNNETVIGAVAFGQYSLLQGKQTVKCALSYETFVHPDYRGQGIFSDLLALATNVLKEDGIQLMLNFPNSSSLPGFKKMGWKYLDIVNYYIKPVRLFKVLLKLNQLRVPFLNLDNRAVDNTFFHKADKNDFDLLHHQPSTEYLTWRFATSFAGHYKLFSTESGQVICRVGKRGNLREAQVVYVNSHLGDYKKIMKALLMWIRQNDMADVIGVPISKAHPLMEVLRKIWFMKVPTKTNCTYLIIDKTNREDFQLSLSGIDFHTY